MSLSGSCLCGSVSYICTSDPAISGNCHCLDCKKASGSGYAATFFVPEEAISITGEVKYYERMASNGKLARRGFCPHCGSQLFGRPEAMPGLFAFLSTFLQGNYEVGPLFFCFTCSHTLAVSRVSELLLPPCLLRWCLTLLAKTRFFVFVFLFCFVDRKQLQVVGGLDQHSARRFDRQWLADFVLARTCKYCGSW